MKNKSLPTRKVSLDVKGTAIAVVSQKGDDYICLTDIARYKDTERTDYIIQNWLRNRNTIEFLGIWEQLNNPDFNPIEFDGIRKQAGLNSFILTGKRWIESTAAIGLISKPGRYGGTYAHKDIADDTGRVPVGRASKQGGDCRAAQGSGIIRDDCNPWLSAMAT